MAVSTWLGAILVTLLPISIVSPLMWATSETPDIGRAFGWVMGSLCMFWWTRD